MSDYLVRGTAADDSIRLFAAVTTDLVQAAHDAHNTSNVATAALGRLLTGGVIMGSMMKNETDVMTLQIDCAGPIKGLTVTVGAVCSSNDGENTDGSIYVKGYCKNPAVELPLKENGKLDVGGALGAGMLTVIKDMGLKEPFSGQTELVSGEIAEDLTYYFATSEQTPSAVALGVLMAPEGGKVLCAGGLIVQLLPFAPEEVITKLEEKISTMEPVTEMLKKGSTPEQILELMFSDMNLKINDRVNIGFKCDCSKEKVAKAIMSIENKDIEEMISDGKNIEVNCQFCNTTYNFSPQELLILLENKKSLN
ncbi:MAG: Hsp33 family molecular chaperone HslO [Lachnospiraceae bacterium]|nr:Hsp33 family molecular chaperone HslO [Lachnospiraceae bacterium]